VNLLIQSLVGDDGAGIPSGLPAETAPAGGERRHAFYSRCSSFSNRPLQPAFFSPPETTWHQGEEQLWGHKRSRWIPGSRRFIDYTAAMPRLPGPAEPFGGPAFLSHDFLARRRAGVRRSGWGVWAGLTNLVWQFKRGRPRRPPSIDKRQRDPAPGARANLPSTNLAAFFAPVALSLFFANRNPPAPHGDHGPNIASPPGCSSPCSSATIHKFPARRCSAGGAPAGFTPTAYKSVIRFHGELPEAFCPLFPVQPLLLRFPAQGLNQPCPCFRL